MDGQGNEARGGVPQADADLLAAVERFEATEREYRGPSLLTLEREAAHDEKRGLRAGARVRSEVDGKLGVIETLDRGRFPLWPWGVRYDDGSFELCSASELAVVEGGGA
jgi:hypothetical protein